jgi:hypothetical protein
VDHAHEIRVERLVPRAEHQRADRPEIDQRERVRIRSLANALFNATVREPDRGTPTGGGRADRGSLDDMRKVTACLCT